MVVNSVDAFPPRAVERASQFVQNRWNPYASGPSEPLIPLAPGYGFEGVPGPPYHPLSHHPAHHPSLVAAGDGSQGYGTKFTSTAEAYGTSAHGGGGGSGGGGMVGGHSGGGGYEYHPPPPPHPPPASFVHHSLPPLWPAPSGGSKRKGKGAALSALTLLAFLYFLNMLQSCLKDHMETMNPTVMVMTAGATRRKDTLDRLDSSFEQTAIAASDDEEEAPDSDGAGQAYERLSNRYQLLASSNRTRNPFQRPWDHPRKKVSGARRTQRPAHYDSHASGW